MKQRPNLRIVLSILCLAWVLGMSYQGWRVRPRNDNTLAAIRNAGIIRIGMDPSFPPFAALKENQHSGLDVDLANAIAAQMGVKVQIVDMGFDGLYYGLQSHQADALISALPFDPVQAGNVIYTRPYLNAGQVLVSRDGRTIEAMEGQHIAVEYGSGGDESARLWERRLHALNITRFPDPNSALDAVEHGEADGAIVDAISARLYEDKHPDLKEQIVTYEGYVIAVRNQSGDLAGVINAALNTLEANGTLDRIIARWL
jgi:polar amino acid transport system substrate-binding protein